MHAVEIAEQARLMMSALGPRAIAEAARKAQELERQGHDAEAEDWRRIEAALVQLAGPRAT
jgi:hypothetical protein